MKFNVGGVGRVPIVIHDLHKVKSVENPKKQNYPYCPIVEWTSPLVLS